MHPEIAVLSKKYELPLDLVHELNALWAGRASSSAVTIDISVEQDLPPPTPDSLRIAGRYEDLGPLGMGGMGEVRRVRDVELNRTLAMKILHAPLLAHPSALMRFLEEARATAQLQHPSIVPVHDIGRMSDGRRWFTMKEIRGRTFTEVVEEVHAASVERWEAGASGWTFRRLITAFHAVCNAMAYAHARGVVHRDLKPDNVMVGIHGEVYVLDWGLAKVVGQPAHEEQAAPDEPARLVRPRTQLGQISGTPAYMAPEQARGEVDRIDARSDVYALGAMLYEILTGNPPFVGSARAVLAQVVAGPPRPPGRPTPPPPAELVAACERAMAREPEARFPTAATLADEVQAWLDGSRRREQALEVTERALAGIAEANALLARAAALRAEGDALLEGIAGWQPEEDKAPGWAKLAEADAVARAARLKQLEVDQGLHAALQIAPDLEEAHVALVEWYRARHHSAENARDREAVAEAETLLRTHVMALPTHHPVHQQATAWLRGDGAFTLVTDPPGAEVLLFRYVERNRRLVEVFERSLGHTPLRGVSLPMGSYLCLLRHPARAEVRYPIEVARQGHWDGVPPGEQEPQPVWLPPPTYLDKDEIYVPAGWFRAGGDVSNLPAMRLWCDARVMHRFPITNAQYITFLDALVADGQEEEALRVAPRDRGGKEGDLGPLIYGYEKGRFFLRPDADGDMWQMDWPAVHTDWSGAQSYLRWLARQTGRPWRLPGEFEWEKAARGVDGRFYPWGDVFDPSWCRMSDSHRGRRTLATVDCNPVDCSPFGVRELAGNVQDMCLDLYDQLSSIRDQRVVVGPYEEADLRTMRVARGGAWTSAARHSRLPNRLRALPHVRYPYRGFRGIFPVTPPAPPASEE